MIRRCLCSLRKCLSLCNFYGRRAVVIFLDDLVVIVVSALVLSMFWLAISAAYLIGSVAIFRVYVVTFCLRYPLCTVANLVRFRISHL